MCTVAAQTLAGAAYLGQEHITQISARFSIGCVIEFYFAAADRKRSSLGFSLVCGVCACVYLGGAGGGTVSHMPRDSGRRCPLTAAGNSDHIGDP